VTTTASTGTSVSSRRIRYAVTRCERAPAETTAPATSRCYFSTHTL